MSEFKMGILSLVLCWGALYAFASATGLGLHIFDMASQLVQLGTDLLHRLLL
ncbi:hypothetical protein JJQ59_37610 (plasmid) [Cupriavidus necator]|uniref:hypothetical protein n=1 Tax=Cupriavidus necator TaxID=106590 RepID=UPI0016755073|nr:hypothetical protein [Cupriavidus necator]QQX89270.1 hypothetical protein JJQ59_37610 [Cupriavidus necator]